MVMQFYAGFFPFIREIRKPVELKSKSSTVSNTLHLDHFLNLQNTSFY